MIREGFHTVQNFCVCVKDTGQYRGWGSHRVHVLCPSHQQSIRTQVQTQLLKKRHHHWPAHAFVNVHGSYVVHDMITNRNKMSTLNPTWRLGGSEFLNVSPLSNRSEKAGGTKLKRLESIHCLGVQLSTQILQTNRREDWIRGRQMHQQREQQRPKRHRISHRLRQRII